MIKKYFLALLAALLTCLLGSAHAEKVYNTDLVIVGSGVAGLTAAAYASENGVNVILIEKMATVGGQLTLIEGTFAVETNAQRRDMVGLNKADAFNQTMNYAAWKANSALVKKLIDRSDDLIAWLIASGVKMGSVITDTPDGNRVYHTYESNNPGKQYIDSMLKIINDHKGVILTETPAVSLITDDKGNVIGVMAESEEDGKVQINAKAVLLATGSYAQNKEILLRYNPYFPENVNANGLKGNMGEGILMGQKIGADVANMDVIISEGAVPTNTLYDELYSSPKMLDAYMILKATSLWVNKSGTRFMNEGHSGDFTIVSNALIANGHTQIVIMDDTKRVDLMSQSGSDSNYFTLYDRGQLITHFDDVVADGLKRGYAFKANTIEELARQMGMDPLVIKATVDRYNELALKGEDLDLGKDPRLMIPIVKPPFYAFKGENTICDVSGGLKINHHAQVLHTNGLPIQGLYAAGASSGGMYGNNYPYIMPGFASSMSMNTGRFAVEHFAETVLKKPIR